MESRNRYKENDYLKQLQNTFEELCKKADPKLYDQKYINFFDDTDLVHKKHELLAIYIRKFEDIIARYNAGSKQDELREINETIKLVADLHEHTRNFIKLNSSTLNKHINSGKSIGENVVYYGSKLAMLGGLYATASLSLIPAAMAWYGSNKVSTSINHQLKLNEEDTTTIMLLNMVQKELENTYSVLSEILTSNHITPQATLKVPKTEINSLEQLSSNLLNTFFNRSSNNSNTENNLNQFSNATKDYIDKIKQEKFLDEINHLNLTENEKELLEKFKDKITDEYMNIPVLLNGNVFDLDTLLKINPNSSGERKDPYSNYLFNLCHITDARPTANELKEIIMLIKKQREIKNSDRNYRY